MNLPPGLTEDAIVDLIDGALEPGDAARVRSLVARDSNLDRLVAGMLADRAAIGAMPEVAPPMDLVGEARARYDTERRGDELLRLAGSPAERDADRAAVVRSHRAAGNDPWAGVRKFGGLAAAAAVVLAIGAGVAVVGWSVFAPKTTGPGIAAQDPLSPGARVAKADPGATGTGGADPSAIARAEPDGSGGAGGSDETLVRVALLREADRAAAPELARSQRLLVHVVSMDAERVARAMHETAPTARFRVTTDADRVTRLALLGANFDAGAHGTQRGLASRVARELPGPGIAWIERASGVRPASGAWRARPDAWTARLSPDERGIAALVAALEQTGARVTLIELDEPLPEAMDLSDDAALWWSDPASEWPARCVVPVLVDDLELE